MVKSYIITYRFGYIRCGIKCQFFFCYSNYFALKQLRDAENEGGDCNCANIAIDDMRSRFFVSIVPVIFDRMSRRRRDKCG